MPGNRRFATGARPSPRHKLAAAMPFRAPAVVPTQFFWKPTQLSMWGNDTEGDCVTAEEAFAKVAWTGNYFVSDAMVMAWASQNGFANGADLTSVMDAMAKSGFPYNHSLLGDGPYTSVDYSDEPTLQAAISVGPVKIGIDSQALPSSAGTQQGWYATGGSPGQYTSEDHCVSLAAFGPAAWLFEQIQQTLPSALTAGQIGYLLFTWSTLGFVDHPWIMSTCGEAWSRNPTTTGGPSPPPAPPPPPPPSAGWSGGITYQSGMIQTISPAPPPSPGAARSSGQPLLVSDVPTLARVAAELEMLARRMQSLYGTQQSR